MCSRGLFAATLVAAAVAARGQPVRGQPVHYRRGRGLLEGNRTLGSRKERGVLVNSLSSPVPIRSDTRREPSETPRRSAVRQIPGRNRTVAAKTQQAKSQQAVKQPASAKKQQKKAQRLEALKARLARKDARLPNSQGIAKRKSKRRGTRQAASRGADAGTDPPQVQREPPDSAVDVPRGANVNSAGDAAPQSDGIGQSSDEDEYGSDEFEAAADDVPPGAGGCGD